MTKPILCAGRLYCDLVFAGASRLPTAGTEVFAPGLSLHAGGGAFITAATFSALGHAVRQFSRLPAAPFDSIVLSELDTFNVNARHCVPATPSSDPQLTVAMTTPDDRAFLTRADGPALPSLSSINWTDFRHLHIGELGTLQENPTLIAHARSAGLTISLDCGWQDSFDTDATSLIAAVDVFLPNESELASLTAVGIPDICAPLTVVKCGPNGSRGSTGSTWIHRQNTPVKIVDATGAGDAFNAGFLSKWLSKASLADCLDQGNACGAAAVQSSGGASCLTAAMAD